MNSDSESNVSGFIKYNDNTLKQLYRSMIQNMDIINQDLLQVERNMKHIVKQSGHLENHLNAVLHSLPKPNIQLPQLE